MSEALKIHKKDSSCDFAVHGPPAICTCPANGITPAQPLDIVFECLLFLGDHAIRHPDVPDLSCVQATDEVGTHAS